MLNFVVVDDDNAVNVKFNIHVGWKWMYIGFSVSTTDSFSSTYFSHCKFVAVCYMFFSLYARASFSDF